MAGWPLTFLPPRLEFKAMTFAAGFFGAVGISVFGPLVFLIVAAWRDPYD
jgi:hypothetical protein